jgi:hypothetical protein
VFKLAHFDERFFHVVSGFDVVALENVLYLVSRDLHANPTIHTGLN